MPDAKPPLSVTVYYASTTGTAARFAEQLTAQIFALRVGGWRVAVRAVNAAVASPEALEAEAGAAIFLLPTWSGGAPPPSAAALCAHVRELATCVVAAERQPAA